MGIKDYSKWMFNNFAQAFKMFDYSKNIPLKFDNIYIDLNYVLHFTLNGTSTLNIKQFIYKLHNNLNYILSLYYPTRSVTICIDGPASFAKLLEQKKRRAENNDRIDVSSVLSSTHLTFGTNVMNEITLSLPSFIKGWKIKNKYLDVEFKINGTDISGEGEIKMFNEILLNDQKRKYENHIVVSSDADTYLLAISLNKLEIYIAVLKFTINGKINYVFSIDMFMKLFFEKLNYVNHTALLRRKSDIRPEFVFVSLLLGNDYFPKLNLSFTQIIDTYFNFAKNRNNSFIIKTKYVSKTKRKCYLILDNAISMFTELEITFLKRKKEQLIYNEKKRKNTESYISGLLWCMDTYVNGSCPNYYYCYDREIKPNTREILQFLKEEKSKGLTELFYDDTHKECNTLPNKRAYELILLPQYMRLNKANEKTENIINLTFPDMHGFEFCETCMKLRNKYSTIKKLKKGISATKPIILELKEHRKIDHKYIFNKTELLKFIEFVDKLD